MLNNLDATKLCKGSQVEQIGLFTLIGYVSEDAPLVQALTDLFFHTQANQASFHTSRNKSSASKTLRYQWVCSSRSSRQWFGTLIPAGQIRLSRSSTISLQIEVLPSACQMVAEALQSCLSVHTFPPRPVRSCVVTARSMKSDSYMESSPTLCHDMPENAY